MAHLPLSIRMSSHSNQGHRDTPHEETFIPARNREHGSSALFGPFSATPAEPSVHCDASSCALPDFASGLQSFSCTMSLRLSRSMLALAIYSGPLRHQPPMRQCLPTLCRHLLALSITIVQLFFENRLTISLHLVALVLVGTLPLNRVSHYPLSTKSPSPLLMAWPRMLSLFCVSCPE